MVKAQGAIADISIDLARDRILRAVREVPGRASRQKRQSRRCTAKPMLISRWCLARKQQSAGEAARDRPSAAPGNQQATWLADGGKTARSHSHGRGKTANASGELPALCRLQPLSKHRNQNQNRLRDRSQRRAGRALSAEPVQDTMSLRPDPEAKSDATTPD